MLSSDQGEATLLENGVRAIEEGVKTDFSQAMSYGDYLGLDALLGAQQPLSSPPHHDELLFIIQHQTSELWLKLVLHELRAARTLLDADDMQQARKCLARVKHVLRTMTDQWSVLATLTPHEYSEFRGVLGSASGFQSWQYRAVEFILGNKNAAILAVFRGDPAVHEVLAQLLDEPTVYDSFLRLLARTGHAVPQQILQRDVRNAWVEQPELIPVYKAIYDGIDSHWEEYATCEDLVDLEDAFQLWRFRHLRTVQRTIGFKTGTGGSSGVDFLKRALELTFFPELFSVRTQIESEMCAQPVSVADLWLGSKRGPTVVAVNAGKIAVSDADPMGSPRIPLTLMPGVIDHHVHLGLVERALLADGPIVEVHDLGWALQEVKRWRAAPPRGVTIRLAGPFHTAVGGYPSGRSWAPDAAVRGVRDEDDARAAVAAAAAEGVDAIKIALQTEMPLLSDTLLDALVTTAHEAGLPAIVHAEGPGQAQRAIDAGADTLVHAPWSERLSDEVLTAGSEMTWISTLAIHDGEARAIASDNLRRFRAAGGTVRYGTDMGNGPSPAGPSGPEISALEQAGLTADELICALTGVGDDSPIAAERWLVSRQPLPGTAAELISWLSDCRRLRPADLEELS